MDELPEAMLIKTRRDHSSHCLGFSQEARRRTALHEHNHPRARGFTLIELMLTVTVVGILVSFGSLSLRTYGQQQRARLAGQALSWSVRVARTNAIRAGTQMALVVDESARTLLVRDTAGTEYYQQTFGPDSELELETLQLDLDGDSLIFSRRGLCLNCRSDRTTDFFIEAADMRYTLEVSLLGRTELKRRD